jgi:hypothetical protein
MAVAKRYLSDAWRNYAEGWERSEHRMAAQDDPHTMGPVHNPIYSNSMGFYSRHCSCGWGLGTQSREHLMEAAKRHRRWVAYYRRLAKKS